MKHIRNAILSIILAANVLIIALLLLAAYSSHIYPGSHPTASCTGLAFPLFACANGAFLIGWLLIRRYKVALIPAIALIGTLPQLRSYCPLNATTTPLPDGCIQLLSYNTMGFNGMEKVDGQSPILNYLRHSGADILCLQEYATDRTHLTQREVNRALCNYPYHCIHKIGNTEGHTNQIACYSKFPILGTHTLHYNSDYNGSIVYTLKIGNDTITLINNHLESNKLTKADKVIYEEMLKTPEKEKVKHGAKLLIGKLAEASKIRSAQADSIAKQIQKLNYTKTIVCGDFNDIALSYTHRTIAHGMVDAFIHTGRGPGISYNQNKFYFRIDHILTSPDLQPYNCQVDRSIKESDHYPIRCYLQITG